MKKNRKKILKWVLFSVITILVTGVIVGYKMYTKPHRSVEITKAIQVAANRLATEYENDEPGSNGAYLDKVLEVTGDITEISKNQKGETIIVLKGTDMSTVRCTVEGNEPAQIKTGDNITLKGICTGYLTDVVMVRCLVQNK